jgi:3-oxoacyl-[acyl-carrier protein] reductase
MIDPQLRDKVALITGANHGIGAVTAIALASQGVKVFLTYFCEASRYSPEELEAARQAGIGGDKLYRALQAQSSDRVIQEILDTGGTAAAQEADLGNPDNIPWLFDLCEAQLGPVDILINNHTHCVLETFDPALVTDEVSTVHLVSTQGIDRHFAINARACALMMSEYLKRYLARNGQWGRIINLSTDAAHAHTANVSYAASKHALESYSRSAAAEMGKYGTTVNIIAPGPIQTGYISPEDEADIVMKTPLSRIGLPEDIADVIVFLVSQQARWLTGQLIYVGGGWRMHQ